MTDPKKLKELSTFEAWDCRKQAINTPKPCGNGNKCAVPFRQNNITDTRYMETCRSECPQKYPWLGDSEGTGIAGRDNYIYQVCLRTLFFEFHCDFSINFIYIYDFYRTKSRRRAKAKAQSKHSFSLYSSSLLSLPRAYT